MAVSDRKSATLCSRVSSLQNNRSIKLRQSLITPKKILEPYGIYGGNPAKLIRHRFDERIIALLLEIAWWEKPVAWVRKNIDIFNMDLTSDIGKSLEMLTQLKNDLS